jgi:NACHT domain
MRNQTQRAPLTFGATALDGTLIATLLQIAEKNGGKLLGVAADSAGRLKKHLEVNFSDYFDNTIARCSNVTTLFDRSKPIPLASIYVRTRFEFSGMKVSDGVLRETILSLPARDSVRIFLIIGPAGRGKTFFLRWLFLSLLENQEAKIPFYVELRGINLQPEVNLTKYLFDAITSRRAKLSFELFDSGME